MQNKNGIHAVIKTVHFKGTVGYIVFQFDVVKNLNFSDFTENKK